MALDHLRYSAEMDLRHQGMALRDFAIPALEWAIAQLEPQEDQP